MLIPNNAVAVKQYNWRGELSCYIIGSMTIPCADGNSHFHELQEKIKNGEIEIREPEFTSCRETRGEADDLTGYQTNLGFVPNDVENKLFQLLKMALAAGRFSISCSDVETQATIKIETLIFCVVMERGWHHLSAEIHRELKYQPNESAVPVGLMVRIGNLPEPAEDIIPHIFKVFGVEAPEGPSCPLPALKGGLVQIEVPTRLLRKLFRNGSQLREKTVEPYLRDSLEKHYVETGRSPDKGPGILWLLENANHFLVNTIADLSNVALQVFAQEFGGTVPGHVSERSLLQCSIVFAKQACGPTILWRMHMAGEYSFSLAGEWPDGASLRSFAEKYPREKLDFPYVSSRIRQLFQSGFAMEALAVANSVFEVTLCYALTNAVRVDNRAYELMNTKGHGYRLKALRLLIENKTEPVFGFCEFPIFVDTMIETYDARNAYMHRLLVPTKDFWKIVELDRKVDKIISFITDPHTSALTLHRLNDLAINATSATVKVLLADLKSLQEWDVKTDVDELDE